MFLGSYLPSFDSSTRRVALPKKIRDYLATSEIVLSYGFERCLFGFDTQTWAKQAQRQLELPLTERSSRNIRRFFFSSAERIAFDDQGRLVIPSHLLAYAQITVPLIVGAGDHFEIWDKKSWNKELTKLKRSQ